MKRESVTKNYIYNLIYQILIIILPIITTPYIARSLGAEAIGTYSYTYSIVSYFILFGSLGVALYGQREIAYVSDDIKKRSKVFFEIFLLKAITMTISSIMFYIIYVNNGAYQIFYRIFLMELLSNLLDISWFFQGLEQFKKTVLRNLVVKILFIFLIFFFVKKPSDIYIYAIIIIGSNLIGNISLWFYLPKLITKVKLSSLKLKKHFKACVILFVPQIAVQVYTILDKTMIGYFISDKSEVGYYEQAEKIVKMLLTFVTSLGTVMLPRIANIFMKKEYDNIKKYLRMSFQYCFFIALPIIFGLLSVSRIFVSLFLGDGYLKSITLTNILLPIILFIGISSIIGRQYLLVTKKEKQYTFSVVMGAIVNFILNIYFIKNWGSIGASITTVIAECVVAIVQIYYLKDIFNIKDIFKLMLNSLIASVSMYLIVQTLDLLNINIIVLLISKVLLGVITYLLILYLLKDEFLYYLINKGKKILRRKNHD